MKRNHSIFLTIICLLLIPAFYARGQDDDAKFLNLLDELIKSGDFSATIKLVDSEAERLEKGPSNAYYHAMEDASSILMIVKDDRFYWLGRKLVWKLLFKPAPNDYYAAREAHESFQDVLLGAIISMRPYELDAMTNRPAMYSAIRHDTYLILSECARQAHAAIIPEYKPKFPGATNSSFPANWDYDPRKEPYKQNRIDNYMQDAARQTLGWLSDDHVRHYLIEAYSTEPRNDAELKQLLDILNIKGADRDKVWQDSR